MMANVKKKTHQHHNKSQAHSIRSSQVITHGCMDRQTEMVKLRGIFLAPFLLITHQKLCESQDRRVRAEDTGIENIYAAMHKNR